MVHNYNLDLTFAALSDPTRRQILARLREGEATVSELAAPLSMSMPAVLKHIAKLAQAGLVEREKRGRTVTCRVAPAGMAEAERWLGEYLDVWQIRMEALDRHMSETQNGS